MKETAVIILQSKSSHTVYVFDQLICWFGNECLDNTSTTFTQQKYWKKTVKCGMQKTANLL